MIQLQGRLKKINNFLFVVDETNYDKDETKLFIRLIQDILECNNNDSFPLFRLEENNQEVYKEYTKVFHKIFSNHIYPENNGFFYFISINNLENRNEFILRNPNLSEYDLIPISYFYVLETDEPLKVISNMVYTRLDNNTFLGNRDILQLNSDVFRRYVKSSDTIIMNQNKEATNVVDIKDTISPILILDVKEGNTYDGNLLSVTEDRPYFFNPNIARILNSKTVTIDMLIEMFGIDKYTLKTKLEKLKEKNIHLLMIGLGGTMSNFCYFINELAKDFRMDYVFDLITLYEDDELELSNLFRIPLNYVDKIYYNSIGHIRYNSYERVFEALNKPYKAYMLYNCHNLYKNVMMKIERLQNSYNSYDGLNKYDFIIGSPDVETRVYLNEKGARNFICPLHYDNDLVILTNPNVVANELMQETYGSIHLSYFFLNMFKMTLEIIDLMLKDNLEHNAKVVDYSSKKDIERLKKNVSKSNNSYIIC